MLCFLSLRPPELDFICFNYFGYVQHSNLIPLITCAPNYQAPLYPYFFFSRSRKPDAISEIQLSIQAQPPTKTTGMRDHRSGLRPRTASNAAGMLEEAKRPRWTKRDWESLEIGCSFARDKSGGSRMTSREKGSVVKMKREEYDEEEGDEVKVRARLFQ